MLVRVIGGGLAGCEAALYLASCDYDVELWEIKPKQMTPAHHNTALGELVCSNSLKSDVANTAGWLLKEEMKRLGSRLLPIAESVRVPSGGALAVDRTAFADRITAAVQAENRIVTLCREYVNLDDSVPTIIATGPLTTPSLSTAMGQTLGQSLFFFDAAAPIVDASTIDFDHVFKASRYGQGEGDYLNCPLTEAEYQAFVSALVGAECVQLKSFEGQEVFEGCMPVEVMAKRGIDTLRYGPCKPVGLSDAYAVVQLRAENIEATGYNLVGFQTNLTFAEQKRVFSMIPALRHASFFRYGVMHRNSYLNTPYVLDKTMRINQTEQIYVAGQLSGVEGYVESMGSGLAVARYLDQKIKRGQAALLPRETMLGALLSAITIKVGDFQPINANFGILPPLKDKIKDKKRKAEVLCCRAFERLTEYCNNLFQDQTRIYG